MIRGTAQLVDTKNVQLRVELYMSVEEARELAAKQPTDWPCASLERVLRRALQQLVDRVEQAAEVEG